MCVCALPQCCHGVAQLMYYSAEHQGDEEVCQLTGGQIDPGDLNTHSGDKRLRMTEKHNGGRRQSTL